MWSLLKGRQAKESSRCNKAMTGSKKETRKRQEGGKKEARKRQESGKKEAKR